MKILAVRNEHIFEFWTHVQNDMLDHLHDLLTVLRSHLTESATSHEHELLCVHYHHMRDEMSLRFLVAVELVLTVVSLALNEVLYAELVTAEADRVAVRDRHSDDESEVADRRVLGLQVLLLQILCHWIFELVHILSDSVHSQESHPAPVDRCRVLQQLNFHSRVFVFNYARICIFYW